MKVSKQGNEATMNTLISLTEVPVLTIGITGSHKQSLKTAWVEVLYPDTALDAPRERIDFSVGLEPEERWTGMLREQQQLEAHGFDVPALKQLIIRCANEGFGFSKFAVVQEGAK
jgi:hypothetical protein